MKKNATELAYLRAAVQSSTAVGLVIILYDLLVADLERAIAAIAARDIEKRSAEINHAFLVLQQLEGSLAKENGDEAARHLSNFYSVIRCKVLEGQIKASAEILRRQIELVLEVRKAWQQAETSNLSAAGAAAGLPSPGPAGQRTTAAVAGGSGVSANWTA